MIVGAGKESSPDRCARGETAVSLDEREGMDAASTIMEGLCPDRRSFGRKTAERANPGEIGEIKLWKQEGRRRGKARERKNIRARTLAVNDARKLIDNGNLGKIIIKWAQLFYHKKIS